MCLFQISSINFLILTRFSLYLYPIFEGADFKSDIYFQRFRDQIPKFEHFGPKSINFCLYATSKVLIWNLRFAFCGS